MDKIDKEIVEALRCDGRASFKELSERVFLSANAVAERVRRLQEQGVIEGYEARINLRAMGLPLVALVDVKLKPGVTVEAFEAVLNSIPGILDASLLTGSFDYMLQVACRDQEALVQLVETLRSRGGVQESHTRLQLRALRPKSRL